MTPGARFPITLPRSHPSLYCGTEELAVQRHGKKEPGASAVIYSLVETAGANGLSERGYLHIVLSNLPSMDFRQHPELLKDLMPWRATTCAVVLNRNNLGDRLWPVLFCCQVRGLVRRLPTFVLQQPHVSTQILMKYL